MAGIANAVFHAENSWRSASRSVPILMYHRVAPDSADAYVPHHKIFSGLVVSPSAFAAQMAWLARNGYQTITLDDLFDARKNNRSIPWKSVVLTFDDGYQDFVDYAVPVLQKYGFTAHVFLVGGLVGKVDEWNRDRFGWEFPLFDWDTARELESQGFHCDAHGMNHKKLGRLSAAEACYEITESRRVLSEELGRGVVHFAYPFGSYNQETIEIVRKAGFRTACSVREGLSPPDDDPLLLMRTGVALNYSLFNFKCAVMFGVPFRRWPLVPLSRIKGGLNLLRGRT